MTTPDAAAIAASLTSKQQAALLSLGDLPVNLKPVSMRMLERGGMAKWYFCGFVITPLGRAVAAAIRARE
jgi:hypothetical protein